MKAASLALVSCCLFAASVAESQTQHIQKLVISSSWGGLGPSGRSATTFLLSGDHYVQEGRKVPITLFESLESSLREPSLSKPDPANLGISATWLDSHFRAATGQTTYFDYSTGSLRSSLYFTTPLSIRRPSSKGSTGFLEPSTPTITPPSAAN